MVFVLLCYLTACEVLFFRINSSDPGTVWKTVTKLKDFIKLFGKTNACLHITAAIVYTQKCAGLYSLFRHERKPANRNALNHWRFSFGKISTVAQHDYLGPNALKYVYNTVPLQ